jgi:hypothetical protein
MEVAHAEGTQLLDIVLPLGTFSFELVESNTKVRKFP